MKKFQSTNFQKSLLYALNGLRLAFSSQRNFRKHLVIASIMLIIASVLKVGVLEFCMVIFLNGFVLVVEMMNSVIEFVIDAYYKTKWAKLAKLSKDIAAGAVLLSACMSAFICAIIFAVRIYQIYYE